MIHHQQDNAIAIHLIEKANFSEFCDSLSQFERNWLQANRFDVDGKGHCLVPNQQGELSKVLVLANSQDFWLAASLAEQLPAEHSYYFATELEQEQLWHFALAWLLAGYQFNRYKTSERRFAELAVAKSLDITSVKIAAGAISRCRDLVNTPAEDCGPPDLAAVANELARRFSARCRLIVGDDLLEQNFPAVHFVGRASNRPPQFIELSYGDNTAKKVVVIGKGVCFDSGGLDIKPSPAMRLMKKDMGGAAHALALAEWVMAAKLNISLTVLVPTVDNVIAGNAFKPGDVMNTRKGSFVEIGNTDAEGRLILADALAYAEELDPDYIIDFATLTGAARVALGTELPALFCNNDDFAKQLLDGSSEVNDPIWRLPLHKAYQALNESKIADISNSGSTPFAGAITAALFLQHFTSGNTPWAHLDLMAWNVAGKPGRPEGGEAMGLRAVFRFLERYSQK